MDEAISNFAAITNANAEVARGFLEMSDGDLERAIQLFFENPDLQSSLGGASSARSPAPPGASTSNSNPLGRAGSQGAPIQIDSDDEDLMGVADDDDESVPPSGAGAGAGAQSGSVGHGVEAVARTAQEEEDAAMARRLQEEMYGSGAAGAGSGSADDLDGVRSPIRATTETLVAPSFGDPFSNGMDDMSAIIQQQMRQRAAARNRGPRSNNPFHHEPGMWDPDDAAPTRSGPSTGSSRSHRLAELFRPPYEIMSRMDWDEARAEGKEEKKWILVNLQDNSVFHCQALNRDIWKDQAVQELVQNNFIFLQYDKASLDAHQYITFYFPAGSHENADNYPHVSIIDPRTGEQVKIWSGVPFPTAADFHAQLAEFLDRYSLDVSKKNPVARETAKRAKPVDIDRMTEDEMLEMALKNSMDTNIGGSGSTSKSSVLDPDALTKEERASAAAGESSQQAPEATEPTTSVFATIASDKPHEEPTHDPTTTTRIQFRLPTGGRIIRRFNLDDPVRRIYEWLKAEPLEGKEGVEFELKQMPQGQDLSELLDGTIAAAGLKQGTVMVEFVEE